MSETPEQLAYDGDMTKETLARVRRMEIRINQFMRFSGFNPTQRDVEVANGDVLVHDGVVHCSNANVTIGDIQRVGQENRLNGNVTIRIGAHDVGSIDFL